MWYCDGKIEKIRKVRFEVRVRPLVAIFFPSNRNTLNNRSKIFQLSQKWRRPFTNVHCILTSSLQINERNWAKYSTSHVITFAIFVT